MPWYIVFPRRDKSRLAVVEIAEGSHEIHEYSIASGKKFDEQSDAVQYARSLARANDLHYEIGDDETLD